MEQNPAPEAGALDDTDLEVELGAVGVDEKLGTQMEYYFSDDNYRADKFLRSQGGDTDSTRRNPNFLNTPRILSVVGRVWEDGRPHSPVTFLQLLCRHFSCQLRF